MVRDCGGTVVSSCAAKIVVAFGQREKKKRGEEKGDDLGKLGRSVLRPYTDWEL